MPRELKAIFVCGYITGIHKGELTVIQWPQVDFSAGLITLEKDETKNGDPRTVPILAGDMHDFLQAAWKDRNELWLNSSWVFSRSGIPIKSFRGAWEEACKRAGVPDFNFHDLQYGTCAERGCLRWFA